MYRTPSRCAVFTFVYSTMPQTHKENKYKIQTHYAQTKYKNTQRNTDTYTLTNSNTKTYN